MTVLVGAVGQLYQGDLDFGRRALERIQRLELPSHVLSEDLGYGAVAVSQRLEELEPCALVLVGAAERGRAPGVLERRRVRPLELEPAEAQQAIAEAVTGYVGIDLVIEVASGLGALPSRTVAIEFEPVSTELSEQLSEEAEATLAPAVRLAWTEARRAPLLELADSVRAEPARSGAERTPAVQAVERLLAELERVDTEGEWGDTFLLRDVLRSRISGGETAGDMTRLDWSLWWGILEELDRIEAEGRGAAA